MDESYSVCSPRRILSVSKKRREATVSFADPETKASGFHGPKPAEVYGFVGSITTVVATVIFLVWAYVPESWLHWIGIFYYPSRNQEFSQLSRLHLNFCRLLCNKSAPELLSKADPLTFAKFSPPADKEMLLYCQKIGLLEYLILGIGCASLCNDDSATGIGILLWPQLHVHPPPHPPYIQYMMSLVEILQAQVK
ncbi:hypothetical protein ACLB2K_053045 [Fragaria x ananassa]